MMLSFKFFASLILVSSLQQSSKAIQSEGKDFIARSCLDYLRGGVFESDFYKLFDSNGIYMAYCDFSSEPGAAWTLVMSWNQASKNLPHFRSKPFFQDAPINQKTPNWNSYRQTLARIQTLRSQSTHWRATCSFDQMQQKIDYRDYLRGKFSDFDIMKYAGHGICKPVDYVNVRGHAAGSGTTARFWQVLNTYSLHMDSSAPGTCSFNPSTGAVQSEDNFGYYDSINKNFRCTMTNDSTTQWWFGGYLDEL